MSIGADPPPSSFGAASSVPSASLSNLSCSIFLNFTSSNRAAKYLIELKIKLSKRHCSVTCSKGRHSDVLAKKKKERNIKYTFVLKTRNTTCSTFDPVPQGCELRFRVWHPSVCCCYRQPWHCVAVALGRLSQRILPKPFPLANAEPKHLTHRCAYCLRLCVV